MIDARPSIVRDGEDPMAKAEQRFFEFDDGASSTFWEIVLSGTSNTVTFGRMGSNGQSRTTDFSDVESAEKEYEKRIRSKLSKGYVEIGEKQSGTQTKTKTTSKKSKSTRGQSSDASGGLTNAQRVKIRKLVRSKDVANIQTSIHLLEDAEASSEDWSDVFSDRMISLLINTWDVDIWHAICVGFPPRLRASFEEMVTLRFDKKSYPFRQYFFYEQFEKITPALVSVFKLLINNERIDSCNLDLKESMTHVLECAIQAGYLCVTLLDICDENLELLKQHKGDLSIYGISELSDRLAEVLSQHQGEGLSIHCDLDLISESACRHLGNYKGDWLTLNCRQLTSKASDYLCRFKGELNLNYLQEFSSVKLAERFVNGDLDVSELTSMSDPVAKVLATEKSALNFDELTDLSDQAAKYFSKHDGAGSAWNGFSLWLPQVGTLSDAAVESLSRYSPKNAGICLTGLTKLSEAALETFVKCDLKIELAKKDKHWSWGSGTHERRLALPDTFRKRVNKIGRALSSETRKKESIKRKTSSVSQDQIEKLKKLVNTKKPDNISLATNLLSSIGASNSDWKLIFNSRTCSLLVNTWDIAVWNAVAEGFKSNQQMLKEFKKILVSRFTNITSKEMEIAGIDCDNYIENSSKQAYFLGAIINEVGGELTPIFCKLARDQYSWIELDLSEHRTITEVGATIASEFMEIDLSGLTTISESASSRLKGVSDLDLSGLPTLSDESAKQLSKNTGNFLNLSGLTTLSASAAESLSRYQGNLCLTGLDYLEADAAQWLSKYKGVITVSSLSIVWDANLKT